MFNEGIPRRKGKTSLVQRLVQILQVLTTNTCDDDDVNSFSTAQCSRDDNRSIQ